MEVNAIIGICLFIGLGLFVYGPWQWIWTDLARQILFECRDDVFDLAHAGKLSFKSNEYRTIRRSLEKTIRFAHELTFPRFVYWMVFLGIHKDRRPSELMLAIDAITDPDLKNDIRARVGEAYRVVIGMMLLKSPFILLIILPILLVAIVFIGVNRTETKATSIIQTEAEAVDDLHLVQAA